ncbi:DsbA family protein [Penaeicola halotolerans]|uniref:DsbA family protein n=1 Tax=Penaeicola halotolerans TaxID=2793196 RepID=UPI001CF8BCEA|nr:DsbA family protein [Penaeicola halotolerans]
MQGKLIYVYDALCGWCYGFSPVMQQLEEKYMNQLAVEVLSGGMVLGDRIGPASAMGEYIGQAYKRVEEMTGVTFGHDYLHGLLQDDYAIFSSEKPGYALTAFKKRQPEEALSFAHELQLAIHQDGKGPDMDETFEYMADVFEIDPDDFLAEMNSPANKRQTQEEYDLVKRYGIQGFPALIMEYDQQLYLIARGYAPFEQVDGIIQKILSGKA